MVQWLENWRIRFWSSIWVSANLQGPLQVENRLMDPKLVDPQVPHLQVPRKIRSTSSVTNRNMMSQMLEHVTSTLPNLAPKPLKRYACIQGSGIGSAYSREVVELVISGVENEI